MQHRNFLIVGRLFIVLFQLRGLFQSAIRINVETNQPTSFAYAVGVVSYNCNSFTLCEIKTIMDKFILPTFRSTCVDLLKQYIQGVQA